MCVSQPYQEKSSIGLDSTPLVLRWALIFISVALSGGVLVRALAPAFANDPNKIIALGSVIVVIVLHFGLALCFKEYFFDAPMPSKAILPPLVAPTVAPTVPGENPPAIVTGGVATGNESKPAAAALISGPLIETTESNATTVVAQIEKRDNSTVVVGKEEGGKKEEVKAKTEEKKEVPTTVLSTPSTPSTTTTVKAEKTKEPEGVSVKLATVSNSTVLATAPTVVETAKTNSTL